MSAKRGRDENACPAASSAVTGRRHDTALAPLEIVRTVQVRSRWDDCDRHGHVNNAGYVALVRAAHDRAGGEDGRLRELDITYRSPIAAEELVDVEVTAVERARSHVRFAYALRAGGVSAAQATALWELAGPAKPVELPPVARDAGGLPFRFSQVVRSYEVGPTGAARPQAILQWLEHAVFRAADRAGWPPQRLWSASFVTYVIGHRLVIGSPAGEGDELEVTSRLVELRRVSGTWHHEVRTAAGSLVAADRARGAFLDLAGGTRPAPAGLLADLLGGEPR